MMGKNIVLYGAGHKCKKLYKFLQFQGLADRVVGICASTHQGDIVCGKEIRDYKDYKDIGCTFLIAVSLGSNAYHEIEMILSGDNQRYYNDVRIWEMSIGIEGYNRDEIAFSHIDNEYFNWAEKPEWIDTFWGKNTIFFRMFSQLDLRNIVELGCGHGRHVPRYIKSAGYVTLVDVLQDNIDFCRTRFNEEKNLSYVKNNGMDMHELQDGQYTALFTYDAMVHFELLDVANYLKETYRILEVGGRALFHHSNLDKDYKVSFSNGVGNRNFMNRKLFAYLAYNAGLQVIEQQIFDWCGATDLDCITLVEKR
jgi:ubiquinone/menaquinone biosynthesis C-methylase UbiE